MNHQVTNRPLIAAGTALGVGMGGFVDGIVFHQILQVHNMLSAKHPTRGIPAEELIVNLQINMFWDGLFHALTWVMTAVGLALLWHAVRQRNVPLTTRTLIASLFLGWGLFNLVEGVIDHHLLHIHHVTEADNHLLWDFGVSSDRRRHDRRWLGSNCKRRQSNRAALIQIELCDGPSSTLTTCTATLLSR